jgi:hypothetical protein
MSEWWRDAAAIGSAALGAIAVYSVRAFRKELSSNLTHLPGWLRFLGNAIVGGAGATLPPPSSDRVTSPTPDVAAPELPYLQKSRRARESRYRIDTPPVGLPLPRNPKP